jgi:hypothetical protein
VEAAAPGKLERGHDDGAPGGKDRGFRGLEVGRIENNQRSRFDGI